MAKKIALLTIWHIENYGAELQTYATCKILNELGCDIEVIDYRLTDEAAKPSYIKGLIRNILKFFTPNYWHFQKFWDKYIPSGIRYRKLIELRRNPPNADIYMVGSDQVWNPEITRDAQLAYFLDFGDKYQTRISYASSFGISVWKNDQYLTEDVQRSLNNFSFLSCREETGVNLLSKVFNLEATNVLDPTLLLCDYSEIARCNINKPFVAYYPLSPNIEIKKLALYISEQMNCSLVNINKKTSFRALTLFRTPIRNWLGDIINAEFVITSSFHGLTMCLVHKKQFAIVATEELVLKRISRVTDLLERVGLKNRFFSSCSEVISSRVWEKKIDYVAVDKKIDAMKEKSFNYLKEAINA